MNDFITEDEKLAVKRGANWMDANHEGWETKLNLAKLNMNQCASCVIGQAVGSYFTTIERAAIDAGYDGEELGWEWAIDHGFQCETAWVDGVSVAENMAAEARAYKNLETLWTNEVEKRLG